MSTPPTSSSSSSTTTSRTPQLRRDKLNNKWVIFSPARSKRPSDFKSKPDPNADSNNPTQTCPFCVGREHECAPEIFRVPPGSGPDWNIRVIQNLYPALSRNIDPHPGVQVDGPGCDVILPGFGFHDVVIETPTHPVHLSDLTPAGVGQVLLAYKERVTQIAKVDAIKYVQVFKNHGASAGASMSHSHSQIIALPIIPRTLSTRLEAMKEHFETARKCILCELPPGDLLIHESRHFISIVPFAATYAFEILIIPRDHSVHFHEIDQEKAEDLGGVLKLMLKKMAKQLNNPPFNFMIHTSPLQLDDPRLSCSHWYLQIVPQLTVLAGFEVATGCHINPVFPEDAAKLLREVNVEIEYTEVQIET